MITAGIINIFYIDVFIFAWEIYGKFPNPLPE